MLLLTFGLSLPPKSDSLTLPPPTVKNRLNPIKETMQTMRGYPSTLVIYKTAASRFFWVRCYFNGKYKIKTTKSETEKSAKEFAVQFYKKNPDLLRDIQDQ